MIRFSPWRMFEKMFWNCWYCSKEPDSGVKLQKKNIYPTQATGAYMFPTDSLTLGQRQNDFDTHNK